MKNKEIKTIDDIIFSKEFELIYDIEKEKRELEQSGWTLEEVLILANAIIKNQNKII